MRLRPKTLEALDNLQDITGVNNRTQIVAYAIQIAEQLLKANEDGFKIYVESPKGEREALWLVGP